MWYANRAEVLAADDGNPATVASIYEIELIRAFVTGKDNGSRGGSSIGKQIAIGTTTKRGGNP